MDTPSRDASSGSRSRKDKPEGPLAIAIREKVACHAMQRRRARDASSDALPIRQSDPQLTEKLNPSVLEVINDSHLHA